jgi:hypothetical protein
MQHVVRHLNFSTLALPLFLTAASLSIAVPAVSAQPAAVRGRSADGKAYRIENGMKLSDYIAELEVANDDLHRQLDALEDELAEKDKQLGQSGTPEKRRVREQNLLSRKSSLPPAAGSTTDACASTVQELNTKVVTLQEQLRQAPPSAACDYTSPDNPLWAQIKTLEAAVADRGAPIEIVKSEQAKRQAAEAELAKLKQDFEEQNRLVEDERHRSAELQTQLADAKAQAAASTDSHIGRASLAPEAQEKKAAANPESGSADEVAAARGEFKEQLAKIQSLVVERKNLLDALKSKGRGISLSIQPLVASGGRSLDALRVQVKELSRPDDIGMIRSGLQEIVDVLNDDVSTLQRLAK